MTTSISNLEPERRCALAIAHPGHEIRVFRWLETHRPLTFIMTDGSGQKGLPRLDSSRKLLAETGAIPGSVFGVMPDLEVYSRVLAGDTDTFLRLADRLAADWVQHEIDVVLGDACEGAIMSHDLWRGIVDRAVQIASECRGKPLQNLAFSLESDPREAASIASRVHRQFVLDDASWQRKIGAAEDYAGLQHEIQIAFSTWGKSAFRYETILCQPHAFNSIRWLAKPAYELHGEGQCRAGVYKRVVRYREHVSRILSALEHGCRREGKAA